MHSVECTKHALHALTAMPANARALIKSKIEALAADPVNARNVKKLVGRPGYRLRVGDWRIIYTVDAGQLVVLVLDIGARGGIYR